MSSVSESGPPSPVPSLSPRAASPEPDADASVTVVLDKVQKYGIFITFGGKEYLIPEERLTAEQKKILEEIETTVRRLSRNPDQLIKSFEFDLKNCIMIEHYLGARTPVTRHLTSNIPWIIC